MRRRLTALSLSLAAAVTTGLFGDTTTANVLLLGVAVQAGAVAVSPAAVERATAGRRARGYGSAERMLAEEGLDLVSIVAPTSLHLPVTLAALSAGANVLVEKPIAATLST